MKKFVLTLGLCLLAVSGSYAQRLWSLSECIDYALAHNISIKLQDVSATSAELQVTEAKTQFLPTASANANQSWNLGRGLTSNNTYADRNTSSFSWGASVGMPVFQGLRRLRQLDYSKAYLQQILEQCEAAKDDVSINVITGYLQVLYCREMLDVARYQVDLSAFELQRRESLLEAGKIPEADLLEAKSQLANDQLSVTQAENNLILARVDLAQMLQLDDVDGFDVAPIADSTELIGNPDDIYNQALKYNHSIQAARKGITASESSIQLAKSGYLPTLSFNMGIGSSYYHLDGAVNDNFSAQMRHNYSTNFGFSLSVPIFDAFSTRNSVRRAKVNKLQAELQLDQAEQQLFRTIQQAYYQASTAQAQLKSSIAAEDATSAALEAISEKYYLGRATPTEYEQARTNALRATANRVQASYELMLRCRLLAFYASPHPYPNS